MNLKEEIREAIEFLLEHFNLDVSANEGYYSLAEAVSDVLTESGIEHEYNNEFKNLVEEIRQEIKKEKYAIHNYGSET